MCAQWLAWMMWRVCLAVRLFPATLGPVRWESNKDFRFSSFFVGSRVSITDSALPKQCVRIYQ